MNPNQGIPFGRNIESRNIRFATVISAYERSCDAKINTGAIMRRVPVSEAVAGRIRAQDKVILIWDDTGNRWICTEIVVEGSSESRSVLPVSGAHSHDEYAPAEHTHEGDPPTEHEHAEYAAVTHEHEHEHDYSSVFAPIVHSTAWASLTEVPLTFAPSAHDHVWADITSGIPEFASRWPAWGEVTDKPATFAPSAHTHDDRYFTESESDIRFAPIVHTHSYASTSHAHAWSDITSGVPDFATRWPTWGEVTSKPTTFAYTDAENVFTGFQKFNSLLGATTLGDARIINTVANEGTAGGGFTGERSRGTSSAPTAVLNNDVIFLLAGKQWDGTAWSSGPGVVSIRAAGNQSPTNHGLFLTFSTREINTTSSFTTTRMTIADNGKVAISSVAPVAQLDIKTGLAGTIGLIVDTPASASADLLQLKANTVTKFWYGNDGNWGIDGKGLGIIKLNPFGTGLYSGFSFQDAQVGDFELSGIRFNSATFGGTALRASKLELTSTSGVMISTGPANSPTVRMIINSDGQLLTSMAQATSASTDQPSATAPYRLPIYNATGTLLGYVPIYSTWS